MKKDVSTLSIRNIEIIDDEPRIKDVILGKRLGLRKSRDIRAVIKSNMAELLSYGCAPLVTANEKIGFLNRPMEAYYLNEPQALLLCMFSRTNKAAEVRKELIDVYMAYRTRGLTKVKEHYRQMNKNEKLLSTQDDSKHICKKAIEKVLKEESLSRKDYRLSTHEAAVIEEMRSWRAFFGTSLVLELSEGFKKRLR